jgi:hypothetical protein
MALALDELLHKTAVDLTGQHATEPSAVAKPEGKVFVSDTGELTWNTELPGAAYWTVDTAHSKWAMGLAAATAADPASRSAAGLHTSPHYSFAKTVRVSTLRPADLEHAGNARCSG